MTLKPIPEATFASFFRLLTKTREIMRTCIICILLLIISGILYGQENLLQKADNLIAQGDYREAVELLRPAADADPSDYILKYKTGLAFQLLNDYTSAHTYLSDASRLNSNDLRIMTALGNNFNLLGNPGLAAMAFKDILDKDPSHLQAKTELAKIRFNDQDFTGAGKLFSELSESAPGNFWYCKQLAFCRIRLNDNDSAVTLFIRAEKLNPWDADTKLQLAKIFFLHENYDSSYYYANAGLEISPGNLPLNRLGGEILLKQKRYRSAVSQFERLLSLNDTTASVYQKLGFSRYFLAMVTADSTEKMPLISGALDAFLNANHLDEKDPLNTLYAGICEKDLGRYQPAIEYFLRTIGLIYPAYTGDLYTHLGASYEFAGETGKAIVNYKKALEFDNSRKTLILQMAALYDKFYADRETPALYFRKFLREAGESDEQLIKYAENRLESLQEEIHFRGR
ncbi:MAG: tetratricopeptide repeat protein [Ignavibacteriales bacterium]|nr:tetratricopeptide repeat protein [Ignavibacteriales bacterium]MCF8316653.1 tetratricopeptide repeat protein [Ignavibacteriales bacterium]MCF8438309.1 tetratricopeptide repeat protein [Ignavibacteriales bacterium]